MTIKSERLDSSFRWNDIKSEKLDSSFRWNDDERNAARQRTDLRSDVFQLNCKYNTPATPEESNRTRHSNVCRFSLASPLSSPTVAVANTVSDDALLMCLRISSASRPMLRPASRRLISSLHACAA